MTNRFDLTETILVVLIASQAGADEFKQQRRGTTMLYRLEYKLAGSRKWHKSSLAMKDAAAIVEQAEALAKQDHWLEWRVVTA